MEQNTKLKLFISYSHKNEITLNEIKKFTKQLEYDSVIDIWYDRCIIDNTDFMDTIDNKLENADIICLLVSQDFIVSSACRKEKEKAYRLQKEKGILIIPIIESDCTWLDDKLFSKDLVLPTDGNSIKSYTDVCNAMMNIYNGLKVYANNFQIIKSLKLQDNFNKFLDDAGLLTNAHKVTRDILLSEIFVYPELSSYDYQYDETKIISSELICKKLIIKERILISGDQESGKTTLCKRIFIDLRDMNYVPIYFGQSCSFKGNFDEIIKSTFEMQYNNVEFDQIEKSRLVILLDDFHFIKNKDNIIDKIEKKFKFMLIITDDIFSFNLKNEQTVKLFYKYKIKQLKPSLRNKLIEKWLSINSNENSQTEFPNEHYKILDSSNKLVEDIIGLTIGKGIMPSYPFFIITIIDVYNGPHNTINQDITSQGYCYQTIIYSYLQKIGLVGNDLDAYLNFFKYISFHLFENKIESIDKQQFKDLIDKYKKQYTFPYEERIIFDYVFKSKILIINSFNQYEFNHPYIFYFFVANYLSEHMKENDKIINEILDNLHKTRNAYIAVFISHHSRDQKYLDDIIEKGMELFQGLEPAKFDKNELDFIENEKDSIVNLLKSENINLPEVQRNKNLDKKDEYENKLNEIDQSENEDIDFENNNISNSIIQARKAFKIIEVLSNILKNRFGSIENKQIEFVYLESVNIILRILSYLINGLKNEEIKEIFIDLIKDYINTSIERKIEREKENNEYFYKMLEGHPNIDKSKYLSNPYNSPKELDKLSRVIYTNFVYQILYNSINKIIRIIGSDKIIERIHEVYKNEKSSSLFLIYSGSYMHYLKTINIDEIENFFTDNNNSEIARRIISDILEDYSSTHEIKYNERRKLEHLLKLPNNRLVNTDIVKKMFPRKKIKNG